MLFDGCVTDSNSCPDFMFADTLNLGRDRPNVCVCWAVTGGGNPGPNGVTLANKPARQKGKNGRPVYSQSARAVKYRQENKVGEFAEDAAVAVDESPNPTLLDPPPESSPAPGGFSTEAIGVTSDAVIYDYEQEPEPEDNDVRYFCASCSTEKSKTYIETSDTHCPICEEQINWDALK